MASSARTPHRGLAALAALASLASACAHDSVRPFPLRAPMAHDDDMRPFSPPPEEYSSPYLWDAADKTVARPVARFFAVDPSGEAVNATSFDEVADSSWFTNRLGAREISVEEMAAGPCAKLELGENDPPGSWFIDRGKGDGATAGFRVDIKGTGKFMLKSDDEGKPELASAATAIGDRLYYAFGFTTPCDLVVHLKRDVLKLKPGLMTASNIGIPKPFDESALETVLKGAVRRGEFYRMGASQWLTRKTLGPFTYEGKRDDDPNDVILHEHRRELRGARLLAAWTEHWDAREQNTMTEWVNPDPKNASLPGYVQHDYLDLSDCFGGTWSPDDDQARSIGLAYNLDIGVAFEDFVTFGTVARPWDHRHITPGREKFAFYSARDFDPEGWKPAYPNPAFSNMTERDGAWAARLISRFTDAHIAAAVSVGKFTDPGDAAYLTQQLGLRRDLIARRYLGRLSPLTDATLEGSRLCATDLARRSPAFAGKPFRYSAVYREGTQLEAGSSLAAQDAADGRVCVDIPSRPDYATLDIANGVARGPLRVHLRLDAATNALRVVGVERPEKAG